MITSLEQEIKKKKPIFFEADFNKDSIDKIQPNDFTKRAWYKGSRYR